MLASQLKWRCRRGVRELDVLLTHYLAEQYDELPTDEQQAFQRLLEVQDPVIMDWIFNKYPADDKQLQGVICQLQELSGINK